MSSVNLQFSIGVHIMQALHVHADARVTSEVLTGSVNTDAGTVRAVLSKLAKAGLVVTTRGRNGFSALARPGDRISLLEIYKAVSSPAVFSVHEYPVEPDCIVSTHHKQTMQQILADSQSAFEAALAGKKLSDVVEPMCPGR